MMRPSRIINGIESKERRRNLLEEQYRDKTMNGMFLPF
jgi:hypothetical protein